jgi:hypothetical protein
MPVINRAEAVIADYFGLDNVAHLSIILGLYQG